MITLALYCKTYHRDFARVARLLASINRHNRDNIPFFISCPRLEYQALKDLIGTDGYVYIADEDICNLHQSFIGWKSQILTKLYASLAIESENLLVIDSDAFFIRDFFLSDFIAYDNVPYTIIYENKDLAETRKYLFNSNYKDTEYSKCALAYRTIFEGKSSKIYDYGPNPHLWSRKVLEHLVYHYLTPNNLDFQIFSHIFEQSNSNLHFRETLTYGEYLLATNCIKIIPTGPFFKVYHWKEQFEFENNAGMFNIEHLKENYLGIILQSNWNI
jgi:hypothetical protein